MVKGIQFEIETVIQGITKTISELKGVKDDLQRTNQNSQADVIEQAIGRLNGMSNFLGGSKRGVISDTREIEQVISLLQKLVT